MLAGFKQLEFLFWLGDVVQQGKRLLCKHKTLSFVPRANMNKGGAYLTCPLSIVKVESSDFLSRLASQLGILSKLQANEMPCLQKPRWMVPEKEHPRVTSASMQIKRSLCVPT